MIWLDWLMAMVPPELKVEEPLVPVFPFNEPGEGIQLYEGPLMEAEGQELDGKILIRCGSQLRVVWRLDEHPPSLWTFNALTEPSIRLRVHLPSGVHELAALKGNLSEGTVQGQTLGSDTAPLQRVLLHWMNLPAIHSPTLIFHSDGEHQGWRTGRWRFQLGPWKITLDSREDYKRVWEILGREHNFAITHIMEITRADGGNFTAMEFAPLQQALHFGFSFAFGRWVGPTGPIGMDSTGSIVWQQWGDFFCEPGRSGGLAWLYHIYNEDLCDLLTRVYAAFADPDRSHTTHMLLAMAVESNQAGRVEQRTMTVFSALELLTWVTLKLGKGLSKSQYNKLLAQGRIRILLNTASIDTGIDSRRQPTLAQFANSELSTDRPIDGPAAVSEVRNRLVHPNSPQDDLYHLDGLVTDAWLLSRQYLNLLILHWLGYKGAYQSVLGPGGWAGDSDPVPWA
ncbi:hypothetical protein [Amycolatopsis keratiniphila]|uniref:YopA central domain-containing protein n=1 Tax=Amycolatopsis keratiniphila subsp. keratiniphila TaxID=227715 RepID=A0A1W2M1I7_9PSEU|nr:hypothetical protein [Amycolatopsis keratiniphila]ONF73725.1 hypothetical protein AVR91_0206375 [Amycolatopsis keratiniphila subsp. keratiniphila]